MPVTTTIHDAVAVITFSLPPVNGLGLAIRGGLVDALNEALDNEAIKAIVLTGGEHYFSGGADIREFNTPQMQMEPSLHTVIAAFEASTKPVIAAINGTALGGGLELALGLNYRVAAASALVGLPEVKIGLLPGAGGTQRLPRAVGLENALNMIVSGAPVTAKSLSHTRLFDRITEGDALPEAITLAREVAVANKPLPHVRDCRIEHPNAEGFLGFSRTAITAASGPYPAPLRCLEALEAAVLKPFDEGMQVERAGFIALLESNESKALRHAFFAERAASKIADVGNDVKPRDIRRVGIIGAGTMGGGIAMNFLNAGIPVTILEVKQEFLDRGLATIRKNYDNSAKKGRMTAEQVTQRMDLLTPTLDYADLGDVDMIIEAVFEEYDAKKAVFEQLDTVAKLGAILASNTSTLDVDRIANFTSRPQDVLGTHFFSPANVMKLLEVVRGKATGKDVLATVMALAKKIKKPPWSRGSATASSATA